MDPGLKCTAAVLLADGEPVAASCATHTDTQTPMLHRCHTLALWLLGVVQGWIAEHKIKELDVVFETPVLNVTRKNLGKVCPVCKKPFKSNDRAITTVMTQMRLLAAYEEVMFRIEGCVVHVGEVHNQTVKSVFTGTARADKIVMVAHSVWARRPDVKEREHLADAQAIGTCYPQMVDVSEEDILPRTPLYEDHRIGAGPKWKGKL